MKIFSGLFIVMTLITSLQVSAQPADATRDIEATLRRYFVAMADRDMDGLRAVLDKRFILIEAKPDNARSHVLDVGAANQLLPPDGNQDWHTNRMKIASIKIEVSDTHPSAATASIVTRRPLDDNAAAGMKEALELNANLNETQRAIVAKQIAARAIDRTMLAMLTRQAGVWKIVCLSVPKK